MSFAEMIPELQAGKTITHARWNATSKGFIQGKQFVIQCGEGEPSPYDLSWWEIVDKSWSVIAA